MTTPRPATTKRPTVTKRRKLGGELTNEQWDIIYDALKTYAVGLDATSPSHGYTAACELTSRLEAMGLDGRSLVAMAKPIQDEQIASFRDFCREFYAKER